MGNGVNFKICNTYSHILLKSKVRKYPLYKTIQKVLAFLISSLWFYFPIFLFHILLITTVLTLNKSSAFQEKSAHRRMCWSTGRISNFNETLAIEKIPSCTCTDDVKSDLLCNWEKTTVCLQESK